MKISIIDIETTGLDSKTHEIIEIGVIVFDSETFEIESTYDKKIKPLFPGLGTPEAYKINGYNEKDWYEAISLKQAMQEILPLVKGATFCANNMIFDWSFLQEASLETGVELLFHYRKLDIFSLAWAKLPHNLPSYSLKSLCQYLGIEPEPDIHRGINGAMKEYEVYKKLNGI